MARLDDIQAVILNSILTDTTLNKAIDGQVRFAHVTSQDAQTLLQRAPLLVCVLGSGTLHYTGVFNRITLELWSYSKVSGGDAMKIYEDARALIQMARLSAPDIDPKGQLRETDRPEPGYNDEVRAWYVTGRFVGYFL